MAEEPVIYHGDCLTVLPMLGENSVDAIVSDPPYGLTQGKKGGSGRVTTGFMGLGWDAGVPGVEFWIAALRVAKPGTHLLAFGGDRTHHRLACAIEDAGWEIRDCVMWVYGSGFPKSLDVSKAIDKAFGVEREDKFEQAISLGRCGPTGNKRCEICGKWLVSGSPCRCPRPQDEPVSLKAREWDGWGTALKPAWEPIIVARKPLEGTVTSNVLKWGTGAMNIDASRVGTDVMVNKPAGNKAGGNSLNMSVVGMPTDAPSTVAQGRWPANVVHDGSDEVLALFPESRGQLADVSIRPGLKDKNVYGKMQRVKVNTERQGEASANSENKGIVGFKMKPGARREDAGSAARFFYCAKSSRAERGAGNTHPTCKPVALMRWLVRLVTPSGGMVLDPFMGSGTTGIAALQEGFQFIGIEKNEAYVEIARNRINAELSE